MTRFAITLVFATFASVTSAQTIETNISGLVIKNYKCTLAKYVEGDMVNRTSESFSGRLRLKIIDPENDILWQTTKPIVVEPQNGANFSVELKVGKCTAPNKVQITLER
jgi:hypothetical protein